MGSRVDVRKAKQMPLASAVAHFRIRTADATLLPLAGGGIAALGLLGFYLTTVTIAQDWQHAWTQILMDRWFIGPIILGFGIQVGLFIYLRQLRHRAHGAGVVASTGTSATAMVACCAHHLGETFPIIGLSGAAVFLNAYRSELLWLGLLMTIMGTAYLARETYHHRRLVCDMATESIAS